MGERSDVWQGTLALMVLKTIEMMGSAARLRHRSAHRANQRQSALIELRNTLSRIAQTRTGRRHHLRMGSLGQQPQGQVL